MNSSASHTETLSTCYLGEAWAFGSRGDGSLESHLRGAEEAPSADEGVAGQWMDNDGHGVGAVFRWFLAWLWVC